MNALAVQKLWPSTSFIKRKSKVKVKVTRSIFFTNRKALPHGINMCDMKVPSPLVKKLLSCFKFFKVGQKSRSLGQQFLYL